MLIVAKDRSYDDLLRDVKGKKVRIWTCNTCARLCYGLGGKDSAERLARKFREDGVDVSGVDSTPASCIESNLRKFIIPDDTSLIVSLTCDLGAACARGIFRKEVLNPVRTFGPGLICEQCGPALVSVGPDGRITTKSLLDMCGTRSSDDMPFV